MAVGDYNVSATVNGLTVGLGRATVTKNDEDIGVGTLTLDGNIGENAEAAYAGYNLKALAKTNLRARSKRSTSLCLSS